MSHYIPPIAIHPGETLLEFLEGEDMTQVQLANRTGLTTKTINEIIKGKNPVSHETALKLSIVLAKLRICSTIAVSRQTQSGDSKIPLIK